MSDSELKEGRWRVPEHLRPHVPDEVKQEVPPPEEVDTEFFEIPDGYDSLFNVMKMAIEQAAHGKGKARHAVEGQAFEDQQICEITRRVGRGYPLGQAMKKCIESTRLDRDAAVAEILGAVNYLCADLICLMEGK